MTQQDGKCVILQDVLADHGLCNRGSFLVEETDQVPGFQNKGAATLVLVGNLGPSLERLFRSQDLSPTEKDPLDEWTQKVMEPIAQKIDAQCFYPFQGPPFLPFEKWALKTGLVFRSPLGILIHPIYGLWHAYRAALLLPGKIQSAANETASPCLSCIDHPCLSACPVAAFSEDGYRVQSCRDHLKTSPGDHCMFSGCASRRACPVGARFHYGPFQTRFHMTQFRERPFTS